jgi:hypothetical protein
VREYAHPEPCDLKPNPNGRLTRLCEHILRQSGRVFTVAAQQLHLRQPFPVNHQQIGTHYLTCSKQVKSMTPTARTFSRRDTFRTPVDPSRGADATKSAMVSVSITLDSSTVSSFSWLGVICASDAQISIAGSKGHGWHRHTRHYTCSKEHDPREAAVTFNDSEVNTR